MKLLDLEETTHTSFLDVLFRSIPYNLAEMKWSLKAGISFRVAKQPSTDMSQLMTSGRTGIGDMFSGISLCLCMWVWGPDGSNHVFKLI